MLAEPSFRSVSDHVLMAKEARNQIELTNRNVRTIGPGRNRSAVTEHGSQSSGRSSVGRVMINEGGHHRLLSAIYDLVLAPTDWPIVLRLLAEALNSPHASSVLTTPERDAPRPLGAIGITAEDHRAFLSTWHKHNVFGTRRPVREAGAIVLGRDILPAPSIAQRYRD